MEWCCGNHKFHDQWKICSLYCMKLVAEVWYWILHCTRAVLISKSFHSCVHPSPFSSSLHSWSLPLFLFLCHPLSCGWCSFIFPWHVVFNSSFISGGAGSTGDVVFLFPCFHGSVLMNVASSTIPFCMEMPPFQSPSRSHSIWSCLYGLTIICTRKAIWHWYPVLFPNIAGSSRNLYDCTFPSPWNHRNSPTCSEG